MSATLKRGIRVEDRLFVRQVHVGELHIDGAYQRASSQGNLSNIGGDDFNPLALGSLLVGKRKGSGVLYVIDGQHRLTVIKQKLEEGENVNPYVLCHVIENTSQQEESDLFVLFNTNKPVTGNIRFRARLLSKHNPEYRINEIVKKYGFELLFLAAGKPSLNLKPNGLRGEGVMLKAYKTYGEKNFLIAMKILRECYSSQYAARQGSFINGLCKFVSTQAIDDNSIGQIIKKLKGTDAAAAIEVAEEEKYSMAKYHRISLWLTDSCGIRRAA